MQRKLRRRSTFRRSARVWPRPRCIDRSVIWAPGRKKAPERQMRVFCCISMVLCTLVEA